MTPGSHSCLLYKIRMTKTRQVVQRRNDWQSVCLNWYLCLLNCSEVRHAVLSCWQRQYGILSMSVIAHILQHPQHSSLSMTLSHYTHSPAYSEMKWWGTGASGKEKSTICQYFFFIFTEKPGMVNRGEIKDKHIMLYIDCIDFCLQVWFSVVIVLQTGGDFLHGTSEGGWGRTARVDWHTHWR